MYLYFGNQKSRTLSNSSFHSGTKSSKYSYANLLASTSLGLIKYNSVQYSSLSGNLHLIQLPSTNLYACPSYMIAYCILLTNNGENFSLYRYCITCRISWTNAKSGMIVLSLLASDKFI